MEAHQLPAAYTFSSTVRASSWVPSTFSSAALARSQALSAPFLQRCRPHVRFFGCLSYGHVKVLRNGFLRRNFEAVARLFSAPLFQLFLHSFVSLLFACVISFNMSFFKLLHCTLYHFFVLIKDEFISFWILFFSATTTLCMNIKYTLSFNDTWSRKNALKHIPASLSLLTLSSITMLILNKLNS